MADAASPRRFWKQAALGGGIMGVSLCCNLLVLKWRGRAAALPTQLPGEDRWVPFAPAWLYVYLAPYLLGPPLLGMLTWTTFRWYLGRALVAMAVSLV